MGTSKVTPPAGLHPDSLPPDFDDWDKGPTVPDHPLGDVRAYDYDSGLPIVKRKGANDELPNTRGAGNDAKQNKQDSDGVLGQDVSAGKPASGSGNSAASPEPKSQQNTDEKASKTHANTTELAKGSPVRLHTGEEGKVSWLDQKMKIARVKLDSGKQVTAKHSALQVIPHIQVQAHVRRISK